MDEWFILVHLCFLLVENKIAPLAPPTPTHSTVFRKKLPCFFLTERHAVITGFPHSVLVLMLDEHNFTVLGIVFLRVTIILHSLC